MGAEVPSRPGKGGGLVFNVRVEPRSSKAAVVGVAGDTLKVKLTAPPVGGAANRQLIELLAETFGLRKSAFRVVRGASSKNKVIELEAEPEGGRLVLPE